MNSEMPDMSSMEPMPEAPQEIVLSREAMLKELLAWASNFVDQSASWRRSSWEEQWRRWARNIDSIYDPAIAKKKEKWQSTTVWPITAAHAENAQAQLFRTEVGPRPPIEVKARKGIVNEQMGQVDQGDNIRDLILREREKARYETGRNMVIQDKVNYGSGFARMRWETVTQDRKVKVPIPEPISMMDPGSVMRHMSGQPNIIGYEDQVQPVVTYRGCRFEWISIWDFFPDPKSLQIKGSPCAYRYNLTYGEVVEGANNGYYLPEAVELLKGRASDEQTPIDKKQVETDRNIQDIRVERTEYGKNLECFEVFARLPKKWVFINGEPIDDPEKLVPAIVRIKKDVCVIAVEQNESYDGEPQIFKDDYLPVAGQFYARGIPEMLKDVQLVSSETINQRLDAGSIGLMQKFGVFEKALVDPKDFDENRNVIRLKSPSGLETLNAQDLMFRLDMGGPDKSSFIEPQEWERIAQERTSITRATLGTSGQIKDANQTLGGQQMLKEATGDKLAYIGMLSEFNFLYEIDRAFWKLIYQNYGPEDVATALGQERAQTFQFMSPEEVEEGYQYIPMGIYTMENKAQRQARLDMWDQRFGMMPWANRLGIAKAELQSMDEDPSVGILPEADALQIIQKSQEMAAQMANQMVEQKENAELGAKADKMRA